MYRPDFSRWTIGGTGLCICIFYFRRIATEQLATIGQLLLYGRPIFVSVILRRIYCGLFWHHRRSGSYNGAYTIKKETSPAFLLAIPANRSIPVVCLVLPVHGASRR